MPDTRSHHQHVSPRPRRTTCLVKQRHCPAVLECSVLGTPDERWGELVHAVVVVRDGAQVSAEEIIEHCRDHLAGYKCPKKVTFRNGLPKTVVGKINRKELGELVR
ncbi:AMP-binding enzyme [Nocardia amamiensis]|nr:hypothetical protein [Nocardia amamiensis]